MSTPRPKPLSPLESAFELHLRQSGKHRKTVSQYISIVRRFLKHVGPHSRFDRVSPYSVKVFFEKLGGGKTNRDTYAMVVGRFLRFVAERSANLPAVRGSCQVPVLARKWNADQARDQKEAEDDLIAKLARRVIDHFLYFEGRLKGGRENLDELTRLHDECRELIQTNLRLFMGLSAGGRNVHSIIDERVQQ
jgi:hypothetical protein